MCVVAATISFQLLSSSKREHLLLSRSVSEIEKLRHEVDSLRNDIQRQEKRIKQHQQGTKFLSRGENADHKGSPTPVTTTSINSLLQPSPGPRDSAGVSPIVEDYDSGMQLDDVDDRDDARMQSSKHKLGWKGIIKKGIRNHNNSEMSPREVEVKRDKPY